MRNKLPLVHLLVMFFLTVYSLSGCSDNDERTSIHQNNSSIVEMAVDGKVYNADPRASIYDDVYGESPIEVVIEDMEKGDPYATYLLGVLYFNDYPEYGIERDREKGRVLLEQAWRIGVVDAGYDLFEIYSQGSGVGRNVDLAVAYLKGSAERGLILSQRTLAYAYLGEELESYFSADYELAREWFVKAAELGDKESVTQLAQIYYDGLGVARNDELAFEWLSRVEDMEYGSAKLGFSGLAKCYEEGIGTDVDFVQAYKYYDLLSPGNNNDKARIAEKMTPEQINEAIRLSHEWQIEHNISMPFSDGYR